MTIGNDMRPLLESTTCRHYCPRVVGWSKPLTTFRLRLHPGKTLGIVGESGCGKSMLARAVMGLLPAGSIVPSESIVNFDGRNLVSHEKSAAS
jgi:peptide/nickel transport system ATP-binding protein